MLCSWGVELESWYLVEDDVGLEVHEWEVDKLLIGAYQADDRLGGMSGGINSSCAAKVVPFKLAFIYIYSYKQPI